ncbi:hypothetical protein Q4F19_07090 [Sphingomonas sp. BIUV-7]|uniref:Uncharacterized protein n=1 Tax=Sphingomonas natans TaxID=3063330 RepID=A0ABT8Y766_9SPHN|nr:hypothetical protein [Sphingomonas sp. BIUV-7]MDO6414141.1 hypothetical protein [Sphingomonas sp. BIUV-7]
MRRSASIIENGLSVRRHRAGGDETETASDGDERGWPGHGLAAIHRLFAEQRGDACRIVLRQQLRWITSCRKHTIGAFRSSEYVRLGDKDFTALREFSPRLFAKLRSTLVPRKIHDTLAIGLYEGMQRGEAMHVHIVLASPRRWPKSMTSSTSPHCSRRSEPE